MLGGTAGALGLAPFIGACSQGRRDGPLPNIIVIMADDQGYGDLGCYGASDISTPRIDGMAREGIRFTDFYAAPMCTAARLGLMTGSYAARAGGLTRTGVGTRIGLHDGEMTIAEVLKARGYATHLVGKWHLGMDPVFSPLRHGFDSFFGLLTSNGQFPPLMRGLDVLEAEPDQSTLTERYTAECLERISRDRDRPFFIFLSHLLPHVPLNVAKRFRGGSPRGLYGDAVEALDWSTGQVLDALSRLGLEEKTLVVYCSDNGPWLTKADYGGSPGPLRGGKGQLYEGSVRVPSLWRWPGQIEPGVECGGVGGLIDLLPTFAGITGARLPDDRTLDGRDLWPMIEGAPDAPSPHRDLFFFRGTALEAMRRGDWKYHAVREQPDQVGRLFDLANDLGETRNLASQHPERVESMRTEMRRFAAEIERDKRPAGSIPG